MARLRGVRPSPVNRYSEMQTSPPAGPACTTPATARPGTISPAARKGAVVTWMLVRARTATPPSEPPSG
eukprot:1813359-Pyramimonas_sp.AAC.1